jgi:hypothetical protein
VKVKSNMNKDKAMKLVLQARVHVMEDDDMWFPSFADLQNDNCHRRVQDASFKSYNALDLFRIDLGENDKVAIMAEVGSGAIETWAFASLLPFYLEHSPDLLPVALIMKNPFMFTLFLMFVVPLVREHYSFSWGSRELCEESLLLQWRLVQSVPEFAAIMSLGRSCFFTGSHCGGMGLRVLIDKHRWTRSDFYYDNVKHLGDNLACMVHTLVMNKRVPSAAISSEPAHLYLDGFKSSRYCWN